ncbi:hypothetical protein CMI37_18375 [Candidatus Pacearchaeota archaeon]|nr:hypothetical protein [Candidatus Pacearchaeota archaeon]|tara:strand:+ start:422 stop:889 length:468 start_codon:yes stop_codon:yes gene_type:complete
MKAIGERLEDLRVMKNAIGEGRKGYFAKYYDTEDVCSYRCVDGYFVVEVNRRAMRILDGGENISDVKDICYKELVKHLRKRTHVMEGKLLPRNVYPWVNEEGKITTYANCASLGDTFQGRRTTSFGKVSREEQDRINRIRARRGLGSALASVEVA